MPSEFYTPADPTPRAQCPCCGYVSLAERDTCQICPVCWWEDDPFVGDEPDLPSTCNMNLTLLDARAHFARMGVCAPRMLAHVHPTMRPRSFERRSLPSYEEHVAQRPRTFVAIQILERSPEDADDVQAFSIEWTRDIGVVQMGTAFRPEEHPQMSCAASVVDGTVQMDGFTVRIAGSQLELSFEDTPLMHGATLTICEDAWTRVVARLASKEDDGPRTVDYIVNVGLFPRWPRRDRFFEAPPTSRDLRR